MASAGSRRCWWVGLALAALSLAGALGGAGCAESAAIGSCTGDADCQNGRHCLPSTHTCVACTIDAHCHAGEVCHASSHTCSVGCSTGRPCMMTGQTCELDAGLCVSCLKDSDCADGQLCRAGSHTCGQGCSTSRPCGDAGVCEQDGGVCVACLGDSDCAQNGTNTRCDTTAHVCSPCLPTNDNCGKAQYCSKQGGVYACVTGCKDDTDCGTNGGPPSHCDAAKHQCVQCMTSNDCPAGQICQSNLCVSGCANGHPCPSGLLCCNSVCSDATTDGQNCGMCGAACAPGTTCCMSKCLNLASDGMNCGTCGNTCSFPHAVASCMSRNCAIAACSPGYGDCNGVAKDGCEVQTDSNVNNCGACNNPCSLNNATPRCVGGMCQVSACTTGFADCDANSINGCEANIFSDTANCGACNVRCSLPHATAKCTVGQCQIAACDAGWVDCNNVPGDGCEANITSDALNCGACANRCSTVNGTPSCVASTCQIACSAGFGNCDNNVTNGCEADLNNDKGHCGSCTTSCNSPPQNASGTGCSSGQCTITQCNSGYYDLDMNYSTGCECPAVAHGGSCGSPTGLGTLGLGASTAPQGNLVPTGTENWYVVTFTGNGDKRYHPHVALSTNPGNQFRVSVYSDCSGNSAHVCGSEGNGASTGLTDWEVAYGAGDPNSPGWAPIAAVGNGGVVYIRVFRSGGAATCDNYVLTVSN